MILILAYCVIGSTADSGSVSEGSTPSRPVFWSLRLSARMEDSQSSERGSIPLGTKSNFYLHRARFCNLLCVILFLMEDNFVFNKLIKGIPREERLRMLEKMHHVFPLNDLPLKEEFIEDEYDYEKSYQTFSFFEKIIVFFRTMFSSKERDKVIESFSMDKLANRLEKEFTGLISYKQKKYLNKFYLEIIKLKDSLNVFQNTLPLVYKSNKSDFIAFLVGLYFPEIEEKLISVIDPDIVSRNNEFENSYQLKRHIEFSIDEVLSELDTDKKKIIYKEIKNLHVLYSLSVYNFERIISSFVYDKDNDTFSCDFIEIRKPLHGLIDILFSLNILPSGDTLNAVFMFEHELTKTDSTEDLEKLLNLRMEKADKFFTAIRDFNLKIPLNSILCLVNRNMNFSPAHIGGAEDWYVFFRRFWYRKFDILMGQYIEKEKKLELEANAAFFLNNAGKAVLTNYKKGLWSETESVKFEASAGFIYTFMNTIFTRELNKALKLVLIDGQFYKEQNRLDYNKAYRTLIETVDKIKLLNDKLTPNGEYLSQINELNTEIIDDVGENPKNEIISFVDKEFETIIIAFNESLGLLINVIFGIVQGEMGGVYDTLSNLGYIGKGENKNLVSQLNDIRFKLDEARKISYGLYDLEKN